MLKIVVVSIFILFLRNLQRNLNSHLLFLVNSSVFREKKL